MTINFLVCWRLFLRSSSSLDANYSSGIINVENVGEADRRLDSTEFSLKMYYNVSNYRASNMLSGNHGGALYFRNYGWKTPEVSINNSVFEGCLVNGTNRGGAFYISDATILSINNSYFNNNSAYYGGTGYIVGISNCFIQNSMFSYSNSSIYGSFYISSSICRIDSVIFNSSYAQASYGGIYFSGSEISINKTVFYNCSSRNECGGLGSSSNIRVFDTLFELCSSNIGGAVYLNSNSITIQIMFCSFLSCSATSQGGSLYLYQVQSITMSHVCSYNSSSQQYSFCYTYVYGTSNHVIFDTNTISKAKRTSSYHMYFNYGSIDIIGTNVSHSIATSNSNNIYIIPSFSFDVRYSTFVGMSYCNYNIYAQITESSLSSFMSYLNYVNNSGSYQFNLVPKSSSYPIYIQSSIFASNNGILFSGTYIVRSSHVYHSGTIFSGTYSHYNVIYAGGMTETMVISHYSTYGCRTPDSLGQLDVPCQTLNSIPPLPTSCYVYNTHQESSTTLDSIIPIIVTAILYQ